MADSRTAAYAIIRDAGPVAWDGRGAYLIVSGAAAELALAVLQPFFSPRGTASWRPVVRALAGELIDGFVDRGECDLVAELAVPLRAQVFLTLFGLPREDRDPLIAWQEALLHNFSFEGGEPPSERAARLGAELYEYLVSHIARRRQHGGTEDLLGQLLADTSDDRLSDEEILGLSFLFVLAGLDT